MPKPINFVIFLVHFWGLNNLNACKPEGIVFHVGIVWPGQAINKKLYQLWIARHRALCYCTNNCFSFGEMHQSRIFYIGLHIQMNVKEKKKNCHDQCKEHIVCIRGTASDRQKVFYRCMQKPLVSFCAATKAINCNFNLEKYQ